MNNEQRYRFISQLSQINHLPDPVSAFKSFESSAELPQLLSLPNKLIEHTEFMRVATKVATLHHRFIEYGDFSGLSVSGQSGVGKTLFAEWYQSCHPDVIADDRDIKPVVIVTTPSKPIVLDLAEAILSALGDPAPSHGKKTEKTNRILKLLKACKVELLILDEFQHFLEHGHAALLEVSNWLKNLISKAKIPMVLMGMPRCFQIIQRNEQMRRRFPKHHYIKPFGLTPEKRWLELRGVLNELYKRTPVPSVKFHEPEIAKRFYYASCGLIDYVIRIINMAIEIAQARKCSIDLALLAEAFVEEVWDRAPDNLNPFHTAQPRLLREANEPFATWDTMAPEDTLQ